MLKAAYIKISSFRHPLTWALGALLLVLQLQLWFGKGGLPDVWSLQNELQKQNELNHLQAIKNQELTNEIENLKSGTDAIESHARYDLGLVKANEIFVQYPLSINETN